MHSLRQARARKRDGLFGAAGGRHSCSKKAGQLTGKRVLVIGAGPIGCLILAAARSAGASELVASDLSPRCLELARQMGPQR